MANNSQDNAQYVRDLIEQRGLTEEIEAEAAQIAQARIEMEGM
jgi:hypothetical protein